MVRMLALAAWMTALIAVRGEAQVLDPEVTMRPIAIPATDWPATVRELLALPEAASAIVHDRSVDGVGGSSENRSSVDDGRGPALQYALEGRGARWRGDGVILITTEARERSRKLAAEAAEAAKDARESLVRGGGIALPIPVTPPALPRRLPARPIQIGSSELPDPFETSGQTSSGT